MWFDNDLFRISYLPTIIIPLLLALFTNDLKLVQIIPDIIGWSFLMLSGNLLNDYKDMDRKLPIGKNGLLTLSVAFFVFGAYILRNFILYVVAFVALGALYIFKLKGIIFVDILSSLLIFSLPYFSLAGNSNLTFLIILTMVGAGSDIIHRISDKEKYDKKIRQMNYLVLIIFFFSTLFFIYLVWSNDFYHFLLPATLIFAGISLAIAKGHLLRFSPSLKIIGVYHGCIILFYLIAILAQMGKII